MSSDKALAKIHLQGKSVGLGLVLTLLFGGLGLFYASIFWGIIGLALEMFFLVMASLLASVTFGLGFLLMLPLHGLFAAIAAISINGHNNRLLANLC